MLNRNEAASKEFFFPRPMLQHNEKEREMIFANLTRGMVFISKICKEHIIQ